MKKITTALFCCCVLICSAQTNWSIEDLHVTTFRNGDALLEVNSLQDLKFCSDNQQPAFYRDINSKSVGFLYNFYAVIDSRGLAPVGYKIASKEDLKSLNDTSFYQAPNLTWKTRAKGKSFFAEGNGYISSERYEVLSRGMAGYYWTSTIGESLKSYTYVFTDNEPGFLIGELPRESFCSVRCVANVNEVNMFEKNEKLLKQNKKYSDYEKIVALDEQIKVLKESQNSLGDEKQQIIDYLKNLEFQIEENKLKLSSLENELNTLINPSSNMNTTNQVNQSNPFGTGGNNGTTGSGTSPFGNDTGTGGNGSGGPGSGRTRLNNPSVDHIQTKVDVTIYLKLTINANGDVVDVQNVVSKTTTTDQRIINQVIAAVKSQVKFSKDPRAGLVSLYLPVRINAK